MLLFRYLNVTTRLSPQPLLTPLYTLSCLQLQDTACLGEVETIRSPEFPPVHPRPLLVKIGFSRVWSLRMSCASNYGSGLICSLSVWVSTSLPLDMSSRGDALTWH